MDSHGCSNGLRDEEIDVVAMAVTAVVVNTMGDKESSSRDMLTRLRQRRALLQRRQIARRHSAMVDQTTDWRDMGGPPASRRRDGRVLPAEAAHVDGHVQPHRSRVRRVHGEEGDTLSNAIASGAADCFRIIQVGVRRDVRERHVNIWHRQATELQAVRDVTSVLLQVYPDAIKWPMGRRRAQILRAFREKGFPNCFGAIDCTHIYIDKPASAPSENYYDRKQKFSVQAQVVVDLDLLILDVHVGYPGSVHDVRVLHNSQLFRRAESGELFDATPENLRHGVVTRGYLLGDNGYPVACPWIASPYGGIDQGADEERFDTWQKVARGCVERAFGRLKCMWRLLLRTHKMNQETLPQQFMAVCTLHNILLDAGIDFDENLLWEVDANGVRRRVDLGIVGNGAHGRGWCTNVEGELLRDALRDRLALM
ncbi:hypothetical protein CBR_g31838 [Chara braunii]|uniref:DDE Tnp4 domain-containing protein n=1 Tax=Chara braunii TaxID=69332 RepID=A0A388LG51_CHABU|nr:hypothetical protein CBR_g31838 [Chara braunii]|eukprot:GBG81162.1 hypothetical protein CBR_g31838 [Chara braunii]